jgi:hypothetical protein
MKISTRNEGLYITDTNSPGPIVDISLTEWGTLRVTKA